MQSKIVKYNNDNSKSNWSIKEQFITCTNILKYSRVNVKMIVANLMQLFHSNRLGKVSWTINITSPLDGEMIGEQLHGNHSQDTLESINTPGNLQGMMTPLAGLLVSLLDDQDGFTISCSYLNINFSIRPFYWSNVRKYLLKSIHTLSKDMISHDYHYDRHS